MLNKCDVLIVGAATTGMYFGWIMAKKGYSVLIIDKDARDRVGHRLEVIHLDQKAFNELSIPPPLAPPELINSWKGIWVSRLPMFLQRMYSTLESNGVKFEFSCSYKELIFENKRIIGAKLEKEGKKYDVLARLIVDASGVACAVRSSLPKDYGVETWMYDSKNRFFVVLHYIKWLSEPHPQWGEVWPYYFVFLDPGYSQEEPIMGIIGPESFEQAEIIWNEFLEQEHIPPLKVNKREFNSFPLSRNPYSLVGDGFLCLGDAAAVINPLAARGIPETWNLSKNAAEIVDSILKSEEYLTRERLWEININHFRNQGAELSSAIMISSALYYLKEKELNLIMKKLRYIVDPPGASETSAEIKLTAGKIAKIVGKVIGALFTGNVTFRSLSKLLSVSRKASKIKKHYRKYPKNIADFELWIQKAENLWNMRKIVPRQFKTTVGNYP